MFNVRLEITLSNRTGTNGEFDQAWDNLYQVVDALGAQGMSSDESDDDETGRKVYIPRKKVWRNKEITNLLRVIDRDRNTTNCYGNTRAGNPPRHRLVREGRDSRREAPPGLPLNFYDRNWYDCLTNGEKKELGARGKTHIPDITTA
jgi:hypothetical protein